MQSIVVNYKNDHSYSQYVLNKFINLGFRIFGGAVRNRIWRSINERQRELYYGTTQYFDNLFNPDFSPETWHNRLGGYDDIDCIGTYEQFEQLEDPKMALYGDLIYKITEKRIKYVIEGINDIPSIKTYSIRVSSKIRMLPKTIKVDMFVCKKEHLINLYKVLYNHLDYECNGICIQKFDGIVTMSFMYYSSFKRVNDIVHKMKYDIATLHRLTDNYTVPRNMYHRVAKMISYGWTTGFGSFSPYGNDIFEHVSNTDLSSIYLLARSSDSIICPICNDDRSTRQLYIMINNLTMHLQCYIEHSMYCYEVLNTSNYLDVSNNSSTLDASDGFNITNSSNVYTEDINIVSGSTDTPSINGSVPNTPLRVLSISRNEYDSQICTDATSVHMLPRTTSNVHKLIKFNKIGSSINPNVHDTLDTNNVTNNVDETYRGHDEATIESYRFMLCSSEHQLPILHALIAFTEYYNQRHYNIKR